MTEPTPIDQHILALRAKGMTYPAIALAISHFTGIRVTATWARTRARSLGAAPDYRRGVGGVPRCTAQGVMPNAPSTD